jgi:hypothetical protein
MKHKRPLNGKPLVDSARFKRLRLKRGKKTLSLPKGRTGNLQLTVETFRQIHSSPPLYNHYEEENIETCLIEFLNTTDIPKINYDNFEFDFNLLTGSNPAKTPPL